MAASCTAEGETTQTSKDEETSLFASSSIFHHPVNEEKNKNDWVVFDTDEEGIRQALDRQLEGIRQASHNYQADIGQASGRYKAGN